MIKLASPLTLSIFVVDVVVVIIIGEEKKSDKIYSLNLIELQTHRRNKSFLFLTAEKLEVKSHEYETHSLCFLHFFRCWQKNNSSLCFFQIRELFQSSISRVFLLLLRWWRYFNLFHSSVSCRYQKEKSSLSRNSINDADADFRIFLFSVYHRKQINDLISGLPINWQIKK